VLATNELALVVVGAKRPRIKQSDQHDESQQDKSARTQPPPVGARGSSGLLSLTPAGHGLAKF
jgi:hypothetical protein